MSATMLSPSEFLGIYALVIGNEDGANEVEWFATHGIDPLTFGLWLRWLEKETDGGRLMGEALMAAFQFGYNIASSQAFRERVGA